MHMADFIQNCQTIIPKMLYHLAIPLILGFCCVWHIAATTGSNFGFFDCLVLVYLTSLLGVQWLSNSDSPSANSVENLLELL